MVSNEWLNDGDEVFSKGQVETFNELINFNNYFKKYHPKTYKFVSDEFNHFSKNQQVEE